MFRLLKGFFSILNRNKKKLFLVFSLSCFIFVLRFPWNDLLEKTFRDFQKQSARSLQVDFEELKLKLFPPGVEFKELEFLYRDQPISLSSAVISIDVAKWLAFKQGWKFKLFKEDSYLSFNFYKSEKKQKEEEEDSVPIENYFIKGSAPFCSLKALNSFIPNTQFSGDMKARFSYSGSPKELEAIKAFLRIEGENISLSQLELQTPLGPLNLPPIEWKSAQVDFEVKESEVIFKKLQLGEPTDDLYIKMKGSGALAFSYRGQPRLNSYNLELQIDLDKDFPLRILDLMFSAYKEDKGEFYRYSVQLIGQGNQVPNMEKLESFSF